MDGAGHDMGRVYAAGAIKVTKIARVTRTSNRRPHELSAERNVLDRSVSGRSHGTTRFIRYGITASLGETPMRAYRHGLLTLGLLLCVTVLAPGANAQTVTVSPTAVSVPLGGSRRLTAYVNGTPSAAMAWSVNGIAGGDAVVGVIDATGKYTAPSLAPTGWNVTATATSLANPSASASCAISLRNQIPWVTALYPNRLPLGPFTLRVWGSRFVNGAQVLWNGVPLPTTFYSATQLVATGVATESNSIRITVANPGPDATSAPLALVVASAEPRRTPTATARPSRTPTALVTPTAPPATRTATQTATAREVRTATLRPSATPSLAPTRTATATEVRRTATMPPTATRSEAPSTATATVGDMRTATMLPSATRSEAPSRTATATAGEMRTSTMAPTATAPAEFTPTMAPTATATPSMMPSATMRTESSRTVAPTGTFGASRTPTRASTAAPTLSVSVAPAGATVQTGAAQQFQATVTGNANQAVTWNVNGIVGGDASVGTITGAGLYTAPATVPTAGSVTVAAVSVVNGSVQGTALVSVQDPLAVTYGRLIDQATFGVTPQLMAHLAQVGIPTFLNEQFAMPESPWPPLSSAQRSDAIDAFFANALTGQDQLRQRVIFALSEVIVEAMNKNTNGDEIVPWLQLLSRNAFGNYRTLLKEITLDASMGKYLDLANSGFSGGAANENFPREVMQLFSIGLYQLNLDGSVQVDGQNVPLPTYTQVDVQQLAKALTGWTYGNASGTPPSYGNYNYYPGPMLGVAAYHNKSAKTILGVTLPANQTIQQDLDGAVDIIFQHPNVGPFLATRLIRALVTSNPSPAYIARVAAAFNAPVRGDMKAVIRAILLDAEARNDTPPATFGRLRTPMQHTVALARALGLNLGPASQFAYLFYDMNEGLLDAASVFGHYSPMYRIPLTGLFGPEFQIYSASDAVNRANLFYAFMYNPWPINPVLQPFVAVAGNAAALVNAVDTALLYGRMSQATRAALLTALPAMPDNNARVLTALYLTSMSGEYLVQR
jgi:hypothetical protein